ncbi:Abi family protein [Carnobacterium maltaromaticum]|uniref:Abi family protein n=1 Tax=Carnobacterium maltaromaticum TaxID=2751 RepID=UPI00295F1812|nr:Abi family protein [Carnobacterium maltaromaticum]
MEKSFKTIEEQIEILEKRNLTFISHEQAKLTLSTYSYYDIINGYKRPFIDCLCEDERQEIYKEGTTFEQIYELYNFDKSLRQNVMSAMLEVEEILKAATAYVISEAFGHEESQYLKYQNYRPGKKFNDGTYKINSLLTKFNKVINDDIQPMKYYRETYDNVPPWILMKGLSFGNLVNFIKLQKPAQKNKIISIIYNIPVALIENNEELKGVFADTIFLCHSYRNWSAHGGRMYNHKTQAKVRYSRIIHENINISKDSYNKQQKGHTGLSVLVGCLEILNNKTPVNIVKVSLEFFLKEYTDKFPNDKQLILDEMAIEESLYK